MSDDQRQNDFAERLRRIEERNNVAGGPPTPQRPERKEPDYSYDVSQEDHRARNGIIWAFIFAAAGVGGYYGWNAIPTDVQESIASLNSPDAQEEVSTASMVSLPSTSLPVAENALMSDQGATLASPRVAHLGNSPLNLDDIAINVDLADGNTAVGAIIPFARNVQCILRSPLPSEKIVSVRIENALLTAPIQAFSNVQLADRLLRNIEAVTQDGKPYDLDSEMRGQKTTLDIFLTDTSAPLYLVVQNIGPGVIWNVHTAPGVTLSHVAIVAFSSSGLVNLPEDTTFEALLVSDFVPRHEFGADDTPRDCMIRPWRKPQADWIGSIKAERGNTLYENQMYSYAKGHEAYNRWYTQTLGIDASINVVAARDAAHVLVGPTPTEPVVYQPIDGQDIQFMEIDHMFAGDIKTRATITTDLHSDILLQAIGDDISALDPAPTERASQ